MHLLGGTREGGKEGGREGGREEREEREGGRRGREGGEGGRERKSKWMCFVLSCILQSKEFTIEKKKSNSKGL